MDGLSLRYSNYWSLAFWISLGLSLVFFNSPDEGGDISKGLLLVATSLVCFLVAFGLYLDAKGYRWPVAILLLLVPMLSGVIAIILPNRGEPSAGEHRRPIKLWWPASTLRTLTIIMVPMLTFALTDGIRQVEAAPPTVRSPLISHEALLKFGMEGPDDLSFSGHASFSRLEACGVLIERYSGMMGQVEEGELSDEWSAFSGSTREWLDGSLYVEESAYSSRSEETELEFLVVRRTPDGSLQATLLAADVTTHTLPDNTLLPSQELLFILQSAKQNELEISWTALHPMETHLAASANATITVHTGSPLPEWQKEAWLVRAIYTPVNTGTEAEIVHRTLLIADDGVPLYDGIRGPDWAATVQIQGSPTYRSALDCGDFLPE